MNNNIDAPVLSFKTPVEFARWLAENHSSSNGIWLKIFKINSGIQTIKYDEALDEALCYGWIDGQKKTFDTQSFLQKFTPRRKKSIWSKRNREHIQRLTEEGRMKPSGILEVEQAKADGRWDQAYDSPANATLPEDFLHAIEENTKAKETLQKLNKTNLYAIIWRLQTAKKTETRERRMKTIIAMLERGEKFH